MNLLKIAYYRSFAFRLIVNPYTLAFLLLSLIEAKYFDYLHFVQLKESPIITIIFMMVFYLFLFWISQSAFRAVADEEILQGTSIKDKIENLLDESNHHVVLISPYFNAGSILIEKIISAAKRGVKIQLVIHSHQLGSHELFKVYQRLVSFGGEMYHNEKLHAKIYKNEKWLIITSLNLLSASFENSIEVAFSTDSRTLQKEVSKLVSEIINAEGTNVVSEGDFSLNVGYCIRTGANIEYNKNRPVETAEYWKSKKNPAGNFCHYCGAEAKTSISNPFCDEHQSFNSNDNSAASGNIDSKFERRK